MQLPRASVACDPCEGSKGAGIVGIQPQSGPCLPLRKGQALIEGATASQGGMRKMATCQHGVGFGEEWVQRGRAMQELKPKIEIAIASL